MKLVEISIIYINILFNKKNTVNHVGESVM
jgi:hypothetical protein